jgi:lipoprotein NlpD
MDILTLLSRTGAAVLVAAALAACTTPLPPPRPAPTTPPPVEQPQALFIRPASGATIARFDGVRNKGLDIAGNLGDPIVASRDGRVVYVGNELAGYGNMVIVKHDETFLTAYAHVQNTLVKENAVVRQGQRIADMGKSGSDRAKLRFEIRRNGTAVDPEPYLSGRLQQ